LSDRIEDDRPPAFHPRAQHAQDGKLLTSRPGQWIDRFGRPRDKPAIHRILVLKVDHIGDLLIADEAFSILKRSFPDARLELICGGWNVELARRLGWFDAVYGVDFFKQISELQADPSAASEALGKGLDELRRLNLESYDLAVDLRYDRDTRPILRSIDATIRAGYGNSADFPYLDVVLPWCNLASVHGPSALHLTGADISPAGSVAPPQPPQSNGAFAAERREVSLELQIDGARSPKDCGVNSDHRLLGVGLESVAIHVADSPETIKATPVFVSGWAGREDWGTWTSQTNAHLAIPIPAQFAGRQIQIDLALRGHVNQGNPRVGCIVRSLDDRQTRPVLTDVEFQIGRKRQIASITVPTIASSIRLASKAFTLLPGRYHGEFCLYAPAPLGAAAEIRITVRGLNGQSIAHQIVSLNQGERGVIRIGLEFLIEAGREDLRLEFETDNIAALEGCQIDYFTLRADETQKTQLPNAHMQDRAMLMALHVAQLFSGDWPFAPARREIGASRLVRLTDESSLSIELLTILGRLDQWRSEGFVLVGLAMGCNSRIRKWPAHYFVELGRALIELDRVKLIFIGAGNDQQEAQVACDQLGLARRDHDLCGKAELHELGPLLKRLDMFVGNNSGVTHFAGKLGVRTIGVYAGTNHPREWGPIGDNVSWMYRDEACAPCHLANLADCTNGHVCLTRIHPCDVFALIEPELLSITGQGRIRLRSDVNSSRPTAD
jgi:ADP-heptose:LPS heptosyltransferase